MTISALMQLLSVRYIMERTCGKLSLEYLEVKRNHSLL
jgi:hypothetical protein